MKWLDKLLGIRPLPPFPPLGLNAIPAASTLLFYGGTKLTENFGNYLARHPHKPAAFHAAFYAQDGVVVNVGKATKAVDFIELMKSTRRIDVIIYTDLLNSKRILAVAEAMKDVGRNIYDWKGFISFGLKFVRPSRKHDFCSDNVVDIFNAVGYRVSARDSERTAPWHLLEFALANPKSCDVRTVWVGPDYK
jgi:hypothetical protein